MAITLLLATTKTQRRPDKTSWMRMGAGGSELETLESLTRMAPSGSLVSGGDSPQRTITDRIRKRVWQKKDNR